MEQSRVALMIVITLMAVAVPAVADDGKARPAQIGSQGPLEGHKMHQVTGLSRNGKNIQETRTMEGHGDFVPEKDFDRLRDLLQELDKEQLRERRRDWVSPQEKQAE